ncbi:SymE family type I addiction module toxin [Enterobacter bugandensis]
MLCSGDWLSCVGFIYGCEVRIRVMPDYIVIAPQTT